MTPLSATFDGNGTSRIQFNRPVTLEEARTYLWRFSPPQDALRADPSDANKTGSLHQRFLIKTGDPSLMLNLPSDLYVEYSRRSVIRSNAPVELPKWVPLPIQNTILNGKLPSGVTRLPGIRPWGDFVVWISRGALYSDVQVYQEFPEDADFYLNLTKQDGWKARLVQQVCIETNRDRRYFVEQKHMPPEAAQAELRRINGEVFKLVLEGSMNLLSAGAAISAVASSVRFSPDEVSAAAERSNFASAKTKDAIQEIKVSQDEYKEALKRAFPADQLDSVARTVDEVGQRAAERVAKDPKFLKALTDEDWTTAGNLFHDAAKKEARALPAGSVPAGWRLTAEETVQAGKGGSRIDLLLRGPGGERFEFDWKTTAMSALKSASRKEMARHLGDIWLNVDGTVFRQQSRSWTDYVRPYFPAHNW
jgi:hypothetical protein